MTSISEILSNAAAPQDKDASQIFANVLNVDLSAMKVIKGTARYSADDAARVARIMSEYNGMALTGTIAGQMQKDINHSAEGQA